MDKVILTDAFMRHQRKKFISRQKKEFSSPYPFNDSTLDSVLSKFKCRSKNAITSSFADITPWMLVELLPRLTAPDVNIEKLANQYAVDPNEFHLLRKNADELHQLRTRVGTHRLPLTPGRLSKESDLADRRRVLLGKVDFKSELIKHGLTQFIYGDPSHDLEVRHTSMRSARKYVDFLLALGIPKSRLFVWYYSDPEATVAAQQAAKKQWQSSLRKHLGTLPRFIDKPISKGHKSTDSRKLGAVSFFVLSKKSKVKSNRRSEGPRKRRDLKSQGVQNALHYLAIFTAHTLDII